MKRKLQDQFQEYEIAMIPHNAATLSLDDCLLLCDNMHDTTSESDQALQAENKHAKSAAPHIINFSLIILCVNGEINLRINMKDYTLRRNDLLYTPAGSVSEMLEQNDDTRALVIAFKEKAFLDTQFHTSVDLRRVLTRQPYLRISEQDTRELLSIYQLMRSKVSDKQFEQRKELARHYINILATYMTHWALRTDENANKRPKTRQKAVFERFIELVKEHCVEQHQLQFYADNLCLSAKYLSQLVYQESRKLASEWIRDYIILQAKALLRTREKTVLQVSEELNFPNSSFFNRYFKRIVGVSPRKYQMDSAK